MVLPTHFALSDFIIKIKVKINNKKNTLFFLGKPSAEPAAQLVQQKELSKTVHHDAIRIVEPPRPIVQVREEIVQQPEPVRIVQHHDAIKIIEAPRQIVQIREEQPARIVQEQQVKIGHLIEEPVIVQQKKEFIKGGAVNEIVHHQDKFVTTTNSDSSFGSFASASNQEDWKEDRRWSTSRTAWGNELNNDINSSTTSNSTENNRSSNSSATFKKDIFKNEDTERLATDNSEKEQNKPLPKSRRFLGELISSNIPETSFTCANKDMDNGLYADIETGCRIYHQCLNGRKSTFLCTRGTLFDQRVLSCNFSNLVEDKCNKSAQYYTLNTEFN